MTDVSISLQLLNGNPLLALPALFLGGVLTSLTPCVYPMIPITAAIVGGQSAGETVTSRLRPVLLTLTYVVGLALVYSALGVFAGTHGHAVRQREHQPVALLRDGERPHARGAGHDGRGTDSASRGYHEPRGEPGHGWAAFPGAFGMGAMSGLVAAPCSAPVMAAVLTWVTATHSAVLGFVYLLTFSLGMCALLVVVGLSTRGLARLPRAGAWMLTVKKMFALVMLGAAEYYLVKMGQLLI